MPESMRLWALDDYGRANLRLRSTPVPTPAAGEVLVKVAAVALNHRDLMMIADGMGTRRSGFGTDRGSRRSRNGKQWWIPVGQDSETPVEIPAIECRWAS